MKRKFLIIGAGSIGQTHARVLTGLGYPVALCDTNAENLRRLGDEFAIAERYPDAETALDACGAQAAVICTPNHLHAQAAIAAMRRGLDVLCEKPMASSAADAQRMLEISRSTGRTLMVGYIVRAYDAIDKVVSILRSGRLGKPISARCVLATPETLDIAITHYRSSYETGGGIIYDYTHELDYCRMLFGVPQTAFAFCGSYLRRELSVDDSADMLIRYAGGLVLELHMDYIQRVGRTAMSRSFEIICAEGTLECDFHTVRAFFNDGAVEEYSFDLNWDAAFRKQAQRFVRLCDGETDVPHASAEDGLRALELADALYESARTGRAVEGFA